MARAACRSDNSDEDTRTCATCWTALWHLDALCYEGCDGSANGLPQPRMELAERSHEQTYLMEPSFLNLLVNSQSFYFAFVSF